MIVIYLKATTSKNLFKKYLQNGRMKFFTRESEIKSLRKVIISSHLFRPFRKESPDIIPQNNFKLLKKENFEIFSTRKKIES